MSHKEDLDYVEAMTRELSDYFIGDQLFRKLAGMSHFGTLGGVLLRLRTLAAQGENVQHLQSEVDRQYKKWQVQAEEKVQQETRSRLNSFGNYVTGCLANPDDCGNYESAVRDRVIVALLQEYAPKAFHSETKDLIRAVDSKLRMAVNKSSFVWDAALKSAFEADTMWMLYSRPFEG